MRTEIFVQARMGSTRFPGKTLTPIMGKPLLEYLTERLARVQKADNIVILTSTESEDNQIITFCQQQNLSFFRGPEEDVLSRFHLAAEARLPDAIVRISGDCPLIDPKVVDEVIQVFQDEYPHLDYVSNVLKRTFPRGLDVEIFSRQALAKVFKEAQDPREREHVTAYIPRHPKEFHLKNIIAPLDLSKFRWTVDTTEDFQLIRLILENLYPKNPQFTTQDILKLLQEHPEWNQINAGIIQKDLGLF